MATLTIRNLPDETHKALRMKAAANGRSVESELRRIVGEAVAAAPDMEKYLQNLRETQREAAAFAVPGLLASDELIAERHLEAWKETVESNEWLAERARSRKGPFIADPRP
jgi:antitoxin FitA